MPTHDPISPSHTASQEPDPDPADTGDTIHHPSRLGPIDIALAEPTQDDDAPDEAEVVGTDETANAYGVASLYDANEIGEAPVGDAGTAAEVPPEVEGHEAVVAAEVAASISVEPSPSPISGETFRARLQALVDFAATPEEFGHEIIVGRDLGAWRSLYGADGKTFRSFTAFCEAERPYGIGAPLKVVAAVLRRLKGDRPAQLIMAPPSNQGRRGTSRHEGGKLMSTRKEERSRAIQRAPAVVQTAFTRKLLTEKTAALFGRADPEKQALAERLIPVIVQAVADIPMENDETYVEDTKARLTREIHAVLTPESVEVQVGRVVRAFDNLSEEGKTLFHLKRPGHAALKVAAGSLGSESPAVSPVPRNSIASQGVAQEIGAVTGDASAESASTVIEAAAVAPAPETTPTTLDISIPNPEVIETWKTKQLSAPQRQHLAKAMKGIATDDTVVVIPPTDVRIYSLTPFTFALGAWGDELESLMGSGLKLADGPLRAKGFKSLDPHEYQASSARLKRAGCSVLALYGRDQTVKHVAISGYDIAGEPVAQVYALISWPKPFVVCHRRLARLGPGVVLLQAWWRRQ